MGAGRLNPSSPYDGGRPLRLQPPSPTPDQELEAPPPPRSVAPSSFLCPIHLDIMADPVTLHTGMTYDRTSIETWLSTAGHNTCPVTNQPLRHQSLIPNHALRRAILTWCKDNPWPSPTKPVNLTELRTLLHGLLHNTNRDRYTDRHTDRDPEFSLQRLANVLPHLAEEQKQALFRDPNPSNSNLASHLSFLLSSGTRSSFITQVNAAEILHTLCELDPTHVTAHPDAITGLTNLLNEDTPTKDSLLKCLFSLCRYNPKNRVVAVERQAVPILLKLMIPGTDTSISHMEFCCGILESLANCAEGREAIRDHPVGVATVVESLLGVSDVATGYAVGALWRVVALAADRRSVMGVAVQAGVLNMLLMVMSSECSAKAKGMAKEMLKMVNEECGSCENGDARSVYYVAAAEVGLLPRRHQSSKKS